MPRFEGIAEYEPNLSANNLRVGVVMSRFNTDVCEGLLSGCIEALQRMGAAQIRIATVPGALEIPLTLKVMAESGQYDALVALGAVIRGETYHFEIVSNEMAAGINRIGLDCGIPIGNGVLTTEDDDQALARMHTKGKEAAEAAVEMVNLHKALRT